MLIDKCFGGWPYTTGPGAGAGAWAGAGEQREEWELIDKCMRID